MDQMTPGQAQYVEDAQRRADAGEETIVAFTGKRTAHEIVETPEDAQRPWRVRWTITAEDGSTLELDEWPPLSAEEHEAALVAEQAERDREQAMAEKANEARARDEMKAEVKRALAEASGGSPQPEA